MSIEIHRPDPQLALFSATDHEADRSASEREREELRKRWHTNAMRLVRRVANRDLAITSDEVRTEAEDLNFQPAPSKHAWGAVFAACVKAGYLEDTGCQRASKRDGANGHRNTVWRATDAC